MKLFILALSLCLSTFGQVVTLTEIAGSGIGYLDGPASEAKFSNPLIEPLEDGTIWILDAGNNRIRKLSPDGIVSTVYQFTPTRSPIPASRNGYGQPSKSISYSKTFGVVWTEPGLLHQVKDGADKILCGTPNTYGNSGLLLGKVLCVTADDAGDLLIADADYDLIRKFSLDSTGSPKTEVVAGSSPMGFTDGDGRNARLNFPTTIQRGDGCFWIYEMFNNTLRKLEGTRVTTPGYVRSYGGVIDVGAGKMLVNRVETVGTNNFSKFSMLYTNGVEVPALDTAGKPFQSTFVYGFKKSPTGAMFCASLAEGKIYRATLALSEQSPSLSANNFCGVSVVGEIGRTYQIEVADSPEGTWEPVGEITLSKSPQTWFDENSPGQPKRFYRATLLP